MTDCLLNNDTKDVLWDNVKTLMVHKYGKENLNKTNKDSTACGSPISLGSLQRIKNKDTAVGTDVLDKIACFFELQSWQLLVPDLDPTNPPVYLSEKEKLVMEAIKSNYKSIKQ